MSSRGPQRHDIRSLPISVFEALRSLDTCSLANAIEKTGVRMRNEGYMDSSIACLFPEMEPLVGYALPIRIRTSDPPIEGVSDIHDMEWTAQLLSIPHPRILAIEDAQAGPRSGSFLGEVHANVYAALGCIGVVTNGAVRDLPALRGLHFHAHASHVSVSHAYVHIVEVGAPVVIAGLQIQAGDLLHGDQHGILTAPFDVASDLPAIAAQQKQRELEIIDFCRSSGFTIDGLTSLLQGIQK